jgi:hypothetical protein
MVPGNVELEYFVAGGLHSQLLIRMPGAGVVRMHVEPKTGNVLFREGQVLKEIEQPPKNALATKFGLYINALQPPKVAVAPITPFVGNHDLAHDGSLDFCYKVEPLGWVLQYGIDSGPDALRFQPEILCLLRQP